MPDEKLGWPLLHSKLPSAAIRPLSKEVYGVEGLSDVNEAYLIQRLFASGLPWEWHLVEQTYLGFEDRQGRNKDYTTRYYLAAVKGELIIDGRAFHGAGASDNRKLDAAYKGAATVAFKNAAKIAGLTIELFKDGRAMDFIYEDRQGNVIGAGDSQRPTGETNGSTTASGVGVNRPAPAPPVEVVQPVSREGGGMAAEAAAPPPRAAQRRSGRSVGPQPKRTNVVTVEQGPTAPATAPGPPDPIPAQFEPVPSQPAPPALTDEPDLPPAPQPEDPGKVQFLRDLQADLRVQTAKLFRVNALITNAMADLGTAGKDGKVPTRVDVPPAMPSDASDAALAARIQADYPGQTLQTLGEAELTALMERFESNLTRKREVLKERGISEE